MTCYDVPSQNAVNEGDISSTIIKCSLLRLSQVLLGIYDECELAECGTLSRQERNPEPVFSVETGKGKTVRWRAAGVDCRWDAAGLPG